MSNKHQTNLINSISLEYIKEYIGNRKQCPRHSCKGTCVEVIVRYQDHGPLNYEYECLLCSKVISDPNFKKDKNRNKNWKNKKWNKNKKGNYNETKSRSS